MLIGGKETATKQRKAAAPFNSWQRLISILGGAMEPDRRGLINIAFPGSRFVHRLSRFRHKTLPLLNLNDAWLL